MKRLFAIILAVVGALWLFGGGKAPTVVATSCGGFEADAQKLFDKGDAVALSGAFAPGEQVHLTVDFEGVGYFWKLSGALGKANKKNVTGSFTADTWIVTTTPSAVPESASITTRGTISGSARLDLEIDVTAAGDGEITFGKAGGVPPLISPKVVHASCNASGNISNPPATQPGSGPSQDRSS